MAEGLTEVRFTVPPSTQEATSPAPALSSDAPASVPLAPPPAAPTAEATAGAQAVTPTAGTAAPGEVATAAPAAEGSSSPSADPPASLDAAPDTVTGPGEASGDPSVFDLPQTGVEMLDLVLLALVLLLVGLLILSATRRRQDA